MTSYPTQSLPTSNAAPATGVVTDRDVVVRVENLSVEFRLPRTNPLSKAPRLRALDGVSLDICAGESLGLVGESGSGKTTLGRALVGLVEPTAGTITFGGKRLPRANSSAFRRLRRQLQMIFQDPYSSLNPYMTVGQIIGESLVIHKLGGDSDARRVRVEELMAEVGLKAQHAARHPHEFSGGQRQRIGIARALAVEPEFIVADEPVSALDVSIQAQILNLLVRLQRRHNLTYLFIAHDLAIVRQVCDRIAVMYLGRLMELADRDSLYKSPRHPYTQALLSAVPIPDPALEAGRKRVILQGDIPSAAAPPSGCVFHTRCPIAKDVCRSSVPQWRTLDGPAERWVACHFA